MRVIQSELEPVIQRIKNRFIDLLNADVEERCKTGEAAQIVIGLSQTGGALEIDAIYDEIGATLAEAACGYTMLAAKRKVPKLCRQHLEVLMIANLMSEYMRLYKATEEVLTAEHMQVYEISVKEDKPTKRALQARYTYCASLMVRLVKILNSTGMN